MTVFVGIDPSTKTGLVMINEDGEAYYKQEIKLKNGMNSTAREMKDYGKSIAHIIPDDAIVMVEGFSFGSRGQGVSTQYGIGFAIRFALVGRNIPYFEPTPSQVKKFASGKGNTSKDNLIIPLLRHWNFVDPSDNVRDAYIMARMSMALKKDTLLTKYQREVMNKLVAEE